MIGVIVVVSWMIVGMLAPAVDYLHASKEERDAARAEFGSFGSFALILLTAAIMGPLAHFTLKDNRR